MWGRLIPLQGKCILSEYPDIVCELSGPFISPKTDAGRMLMVLSLCESLEVNLVFRRGEVIHESAIIVLLI